MPKLTFNVQNVVDADGLWIAATGMIIVFVALSLISTAIALLPKFLDALEPIFPASEEHHLAGEVPAPPDNEDEALLAAIGFALHTEQQRYDAEP